MADRYDLKFKLKKVIRDDPRSKRWFLRNYFRKEALETSGVELIIDKEDRGLKIDLRCPISFKRQDIPMRTRNCSHIQTWGLESFVRVTDIENIRGLMKSHCHPIKCPVCSEVGLLVQDNYTKHLLNSAKGKCVAYVSEKGEETFEVDEEEVEIETIKIDDNDEQKKAYDFRIKKRKMTTITGPPAKKSFTKKRRNFLETSKENRRSNNRVPSTKWRRNNERPRPVTSHRNINVFTERFSGSLLSANGKRHYQLESARDDNQRRETTMNFLNKRKLEDDIVEPNKRRIGTQDTWRSNERQFVDSGRASKRKPDSELYSEYQRLKQVRVNLEAETWYKRRKDLDNHIPIRRYDPLQEFCLNETRVYADYAPPEDWRMGFVRPISLIRSRYSGFRREFASDSVYSSAGGSNAYASAGGSNAHASGSGSMATASGYNGSSRRHFAPYPRVNAASLLFHRRI